MVGGELLEGQGAHAAATCLRLQCYSCCSGLSAGPTGSSYPKTLEVSGTTMWYQTVLAIVIGYLLGSIPMGYLVGLAWGVDVRKTGSGRTGGTNVWRATKQLWPPALTILGDILKGVAAVLIARHLFGSELAAALAGAAAVAGHNWSLLLGWRGGAGGITTAATLVALSPLAGAIAVPVGAIVLYLSHMASVATLTAAVGAVVTLSLLAWLSPASHPWVHLIYGALATLSVVMALRPNLKRLAEGTERRITLWK